MDFHGELVGLSCNQAQTIEKSRASTILGVFVFVVIGMAAIVVGVAIKRKRAENENNRESI